MCEFHEIIPTDHHRTHGAPLRPCHWWIPSGDVPSEGLAASGALHSPLPGGPMNLGKCTLRVAPDVNLTCWSASPVPCRWVEGPRLFRVNTHSAGLARRKWSCLRGGSGEGSGRPHGVWWFQPVVSCRGGVFQVVCGTLDPSCRG